MNRVDGDYRRHLKRLQFHRKTEARGQEPADYARSDPKRTNGECAVTGRTDEPTEDHHLFRRRVDDQTIPVSVSLHQFLSYAEREEHPPLTDNPQHPLERIIRVMCTAATFLEYFASALLHAAWQLHRFLKSNPDTKMGEEDD